MAYSLKWEAFQHNRLLRNLSTLFLVYINPHYHTVHNVASDCCPTLQILDSDKELDVGLKSRTLKSLRRVCGHYGIVPTSYVLPGAVKDGPVPQKTGIFTETWRGIYGTKLVAIKIFKITEGRKDYDKIKAVRQIFLVQRTQSS